MILFHKHPQTVLLKEILFHPTNLLYKLKSLYHTMLLLSFFISPPNLINYLPSIIDAILDPIIAYSDTILIFIGKLNSAQFSILRFYHYFEDSFFITPTYLF